MSTMTVDRRGDQIWRNEKGQYHREDGPAVIYRDGTLEWYINHQLHRSDGPAFIHPNGTQQWIINGVTHRIDGPAVIWAVGDQVWYINGKCMTDQVVTWIKKNDFPDYTLWTDSHKIMFRMAFAGISS